MDSPELKAVKAVFELISAAERRIHCRPTHAARQFSVRRCHRTPAPTPQRSIDIHTCKGWSQMQPKHIEIRAQNPERVCTCKADADAPCQQHPLLTLLQKCRNIPATHKSAHLEACVRQNGGLQCEFMRIRKLHTSSSQVNPFELKAGAHGRPAYSRWRNSVTLWLPHCHCTAKIAPGTTQVPSGT